MRAYRVFDHERPWARAVDFDPLDGAGAMHGSARWHHKGTRVAYAASNASLALLEVLVHENPTDFGERTLVIYDLPDDAIEQVSAESLVRLLRDAPGDARERATRDFGTEWARSERSLVLMAPSIVVPHDHNLLFNPRHPRRPEVVEIDRQRVSLDPRLRTGLSNT